MKLLCIDGVKIGDISVRGIKANKEIEIYEGQVYTFKRYTTVNGIVGYVLEEKKENIGYAPRRFLQLSEINEMQNFKEQAIST